jgi:hypothetical protein
MAAWEDFWCKAGIPPTGVQVEVSGVTISRFCQGKIVEDWYSSDDLGMLWQLGVLSGPRRSEEAIATSRKFIAESSEARIVGPEPGKSQKTYRSSSTVSELMTEENENMGQYLELYKLAVEMADRVSARRATTNAFFLVVNTALLAFVSSGLDDMLWLVALAGIALSGTWWVLAKSYRDLNAAKFRVIAGMENNLDARVFGDEWRELYEIRRGRWRDQYAQLGMVERLVPLVFAVLYTAVLVWTVLWITSPT